MYWWDLPGGPAVRLHASNAGGTGLILVGEVRSHICPMVCTPPPPPKKVLMNFSERWSCLAVQCSRSVMSDTLRPHGLQHARLACPSPTPRVYSNSCPLSWWCHPSNHLILCHPLLLLPSISTSIRVFSNGSALSISWPKYWNFCFSISPSNEYSELISFRVNWFDLLEVQGTPWLIGWAWVVLVLRETLRWGSLYLLSWWRMTWIVPTSTGLEKSKENKKNGTHQQSPPWKKFY